jgi:hypothetical protein
LNKSRIKGEYVNLFFFFIGAYGIMNSIIESGVAVRKNSLNHKLLIDFGV